MAADRLTRLAELAEQGSQELEGATAIEVISWADKALEGRLVVASSMRDSLLVHLATQVRPGIDVLFLDTGYHFSETLATRDAVAATYPVRVLNVRPGLTVEQQDAEHGPRLYERDPDLCCHLRKVLPLNAMLSLYDGWVTGIRRAETDARKAAKAVEWDERRQLIKVNPLVDWSDEDVASYVEEHGVLVNLLASEGYDSIGCAPCTRPADGQHGRSGRWPGFGKAECGIHLQ